MSFFRARTFCPTCATEEEVWYYNGNIEPVDSIQCANCSSIFSPDEFLLCILETRNNVTISASAA